MKAAIISLGSTSSKWTYEALGKYFDHVDALDITKIEIDISKNAKILYNGTPIDEYDCIFAKGSFRYAMALRAITDVIKAQKKKVYLPYSAEAYTIAHDKILTHLRLIHNKVPTPLTYIASSPEAGKAILKKMHYPVIMKIPSGTQGKGVMFADSFAAASSMLDTLTSLSQPFLIQEYIETGNVDLRVFVIGGEVVAAMKRIGNKDDKRANIHVGGKGEPVLVTPEVKKVAKKAAEVIGAEICGIDILDNELKGPLVIEANISPGLQGITAATDVNVADKIARYLAKQTKKMLASDKEVEEKELKTEIEGMSMNHIITNLKSRGERLILPEIASKVSKIDEDVEVELILEKGKILIKKA